jgi:hypothetical protein
MEPKETPLYILVMTEAKEKHRKAMFGMKGFCKGKMGFWRGYCRCQYAVSFGLGLAISCFCPNSLILFMAAIIIVALGIALGRRCPAGT